MKHLKIENCIDQMRYSKCMQMLVQVQNGKLNSKNSWHGCSDVLSLHHYFIKSICVSVWWMLLLFFATQLIKHNEIGILNFRISWLPPSHYNFFVWVKFGCFLLKLHIRSQIFQNKRGQYMLFSLPIIILAKCTMQR